MDKILIIINKLTIGGAENVAITQANKLKERGYEIYFGLLYSTIKKENFYDLLNITDKNIIHFSFKRLFDLNAFIRVYRFLKSNKIDIVMGHLFEANTIIRIAAIFARTKKIFITEHSCYDIKSKWQILVDRILSVKTNKIFAVSNEVKDFTMKQEGISKNKIVVLNQISDLKLKNKFKRKELRKKYGISEDKLIVMTVGRMSPEKNQKDIIDIAMQVNNKNKDIYFFIVGYGKEESKLRREIIKRKLEKNIKLIIDPKNAKEYLIMGDIFILTSNREGLPVALLEGMYNGLIGLSYDIGGISDIIINNKNGYLFNFGDIKKISDRIIFLNKNRIKIERMKKEAIKMAKDKNGKIDDLINIINK